MVSEEITGLRLVRLRAPAATRRFFSRAAIEFYTGDTTVYRDA